jgi:hypothetical protein
LTAAPVPDPRFRHDGCKYLGILQQIVVFSTAESQILPVKL